MRNYPKWIDQPGAGFRGLAMRVARHYEEHNMNVDLREVIQQNDQMRHALETIYNHAVGNFGHYGSYKEIAELAKNAMHCAEKKETRNGL